MYKHIQITFSLLNRKSFPLLVGIRNQRKLKNPTSDIISSKQAKLHKNAKTDLSLNYIIIQKGTQLLCDPHLHSFIYQLCSPEVGVDDLHCTEQRFGWNPQMYVCLHYKALEQYNTWFFITDTSVSHPLISCSVIVCPTAPGRLHNCGFPTTHPHIPESQYMCTIDIDVFTPFTTTQ